MEGSFFLPYIFTAFLRASFSNSFSISFRRLWSFFFTFFFFVLSIFFSIKVDWNLVPTRYLSNFKYLSIDNEISVSLSHSLLPCCLHFLSFVFFWFSFSYWFQFKNIFIFLFNNLFFRFWFYSIFVMRSFIFIDKY